MKPQIAVALIAVSVLVCADRSALAQAFEADPAQSYAHGPGVIPPAGTPTLGQVAFTVQAVNYFGDPVSVGGDAFAVQVSAPDGAPVLIQFTDNNDGTYSARYTPVQAGCYTVEVTLGGESIKGSPYAPCFGDADPGPDTDGDGLADSVDPTPYEDVDGICPCDDAYASRLHYLACVTRAATGLRQERLISARQWTRIVLLALLGSQCPNID